LHYLEEKEVKLIFEPGDEATLQEGRVDFYSFSYYMSNCITTEEGHAATLGNLLGGSKESLPGNNPVGMADRPQRFALYTQQNQ
jgi:beta-glucosidase/6-phospho-beta-glucosidase/beta-galactosidase